VNHLSLKGLEFGPKEVYKSPKMGRNPSLTKKQTRVRKHYSGASYQDRMRPIKLVQLHYAASFSAFRLQSPASISRVTTFSVIYLEE